MRRPGGRAGDKSVLRLTTKPNTRNAAHATNVAITDGSGSFGPLAAVRTTHLLK